ncbi:MAG: dihydroorotate dehydrogenase, partial [Planctomycetota bacterium]
MSGGEAGGEAANASLSVSIGSLTLQNPVLTASGTCGSGLELAPWSDLSAIGGVVGKTVTREPRAGNPPPRTFETRAGMLNSIGLQNPGIDRFLSDVLPAVQDAGYVFIANIAGESGDDFSDLAARLDGVEGVAGLEANLSCPNVAGGLDFSVDPSLAAKTVEGIRKATSLPLITKLSPNVTDVRPLAKACEDAGADAVSLVNTYLGAAVDWRNRRPIFRRVMAGLSGPAIKPLALFQVWRAASAVSIPVVGIGGIQDADDALQFLCAGATAIQVGTALFRTPTAAEEMVGGIAAGVAELGLG